MNSMRTQPEPWFAMVSMALAGGHQLGDGAEEFFRHVNGSALDRLVALAVNLLGDNLRFANSQLEALTAHLLHQDGQRELAAVLDFPLVGTVSGQHTDRELPISSASRRSFTWRAVSLWPFHLACERRRVDADGHRDSRVIHVNRIERARILGIHK